MSQPPSPDADDQYHESSDEDFNPATAPVADETSSSSDDEAAPATSKPAPRKRKRKAPSPEFDSGDEVTIQAAKRSRFRRRTGGKPDDDEIFLSDDEGGEGGLVKTRAQRRVEQKERQPLANTDGATVDVDALWAQMLAAPLLPPSPGTAQTGAQKDTRAVDPSNSGLPTANDYVTLRLVAKHAGQTDTFEKRVRKGSAAETQYLKDGWKIVEAPPIPVDEPVKATTPDPQSEDLTEDASAVRRPLRRPFRFEPNPAGFVRGLPPDRQLSWPRKHTSTGQENKLPAPSPAKLSLQPEKVKKLNVVDKTRLDWTGFVDKEGIANDLDEYGKGKKNFRDQQEFLANVEAREEEERRRVREQGKGKV